jgi:hypothetical protein
MGKFAYLGAQDSCARALLHQVQITAGKRSHATGSWPPHRSYRRRQATDVHHGRSSLWSLHEGDTALHLDYPESAACGASARPAPCGPLVHKKYSGDLGILP